MLSLEELDDRDELPLNSIVKCTQIYVLKPPNSLKNNVGLVANAFALNDKSIRLLWSGLKTGLKSETHNFASNYVIQNTEAACDRTRPF